jgi:hypothetical protein
MARYLLLLCSTLGVAACSSKTVLTLETLPEADLRLELHRLLRLMHMDPETPLDSTDTKLRAVWPEVLPDDSRARVRHILDRAVSLDGVGVPVRFELVVTDQNPMVLEALGLRPGRHRFPVLFQRDRGDLHLKASGEGAMGHQLCCWDLPVEQPLPVLTYRYAPPPEANPDDPRVGLMQTVSDLVLTAKHQTLATPGALQALADDAQYHDTSSVSFVFSEGPDINQPILGAFAVSQSYSECADRILDNAGDDFFRVILFPELARALASYTLEDRWHVGRL